MGYFSPCRNKIPGAERGGVGRRTLQKGVFLFGSHFKTIVHHTRESKVVELEAAGHVESTTRKQTEMKPGVCFAFSFLFSSVPWMMLSMLRVIFPLLLA